MDNNAPRQMADEKIASFDHIFSSDHIRMLKIFLHYIPEAMRRNLIVYIKYLELQKVLRYPVHHPDFMMCQTSENDSSSPDLHSSDSNFSDSPSGVFDAEVYQELIRELLPFCSPGERQQFESMQSLFDSLHQMQNMMEMMQMMKDMQDMFGGGEEGFSPEMLSGMMGMLDL